MMSGLYRIRYYTTNTNMNQDMLATRGLLEFSAGRSLSHTEWSQRVNSIG
jgi:hypothetical protein